MVQPSMWMIAILQILVDYTLVGCVGENHTIAGITKKETRRIITEELEK